MESKKGVFSWLRWFSCQISSPIIGPSQPSVPRFLAGKAADNTDDAACIAGTVAGALHVRQVAKLYGVPVTWRARVKNPNKFEEFLKLQNDEKCERKEIYFSKLSFSVSILNLVGGFKYVLFSSPIWGRWTHFHKFVSFNWVGSTRWFKPCLFFGWFDSWPFSGVKLSDLQFGESFQKVTNGRSWLYQLMVNN